MEGWSLPWPRRWSSRAIPGLWGGNGCKKIASRGKRDILVRSREASREFRLRTLFRRADDLSEESEMRIQVAAVLYAVAMAAIIVGVDLAFFKNRFWERLMANIGIVLVF